MQDDAPADDKPADDKPADGEPEDSKPPDSKYDVAMAVIQADGEDDGTGMAIDYSDYRDQMSKTDFDAFFNKVANVAKMLKLLAVYRPKVFRALEHLSQGGADQAAMAVEPFQPFLNRF
jgi:hypothetical protein